MIQPTRHSRCQAACEERPTTKPRTRRPGLEAAVWLISFALGLSVGAEVRWRRRIVLLVDGNREVDVWSHWPTGRAQVRARGEDRVRVAPVVSHQTAKIPETVAGQVHPQRALLEEHVDFAVGGARVGERRERRCRLLPRDG